MFNFCPGYYKVERQTVEVDKYYVLCLKNLRKPFLLRFSCKSSFLAKRYIMLKTNMISYEVIKGYDALQRNIGFSNKKIAKDKYPEKYCYPPGYNTWQKKKQHRTHFRETLRKVLETSNSLKQFTILYRGRTYTVYHFTLGKAFNALVSNTGMTWKHFISQVDNKPQAVTKQMVYIKTQRLNTIMINQFNKIHKLPPLKKAPNRGNIRTVEKSYIAIHKPKPKELIPWNYT